MRLICPNCDAEYEVDAAAIPAEGRDVQCSNCGHAWFQAHPDVEAAQEAEDELYEAPVDVVPEAAAGIPPEVEEQDPEPAEFDAPEPLMQAEKAAAPVRSLDETVMAVLREEAARETDARQAEATAKPVIETQTEMPLAQDQGGMAAAVRRIARLRSGGAEPVAPPPPKTRKELLPAIEEINSTLRATNDRSSDEDDVVVDSMDEGKPAKSSFGRGFVFLLLLAVVIVTLYVFAPVIGQKVPALAGAMTSYVALVDAARVWIDTQMRSLVGTLQGFVGNQDG